jgi:hypothetical protein
MRFTSRVVHPPGSGVPAEEKNQMEENGMKPYSHLRAPARDLKKKIG